MAEAAAQVVAALPALPQLLAAAAGPPAKALSGVQLARLAALLRIYSLALAVHARCAALHPGVAPLPGQQLRLHAAESAAEQPAPGRGYYSRGYFSALALLSQPGGSDATGQGQPGMPALLQALRQRASGPAEAELRLAAMRAAAQWLEVLHARWLHLQYRCPTKAQEGAASGEAGSSGDEEPGSSEPEGSGWEGAAQAELEAELRALAGALMQLIADGVAEAAPGLAGGAAGRAALASEHAAASLALLSEVAPSLHPWAAEAHWLPIIQVSACARRLAAAWQPCRSAQTLPARHRHICSPRVQGGLVAAGRRDEAGAELRAAATGLLLHPDCLEWASFAAALPTAVATELCGIARQGGQARSSLLPPGRLSHAHASLPTRRVALE